MAGPSILGPWVRLEGISISQLPPGGKGTKPTTAPPSDEKFSDGSGSATAPNVRSFVTSVLSESIPFIDGVAPKAGGAATWKGKGSPKRYASSEAPVHLYERVVPGRDLDKIEGMSQFSADRKNETWFCRRSSHRNKAEKGTASWEEFIHSFKDHHAETENAFTPTVIGSREAIRWDTRGLEVDIYGGRWNNITVAVVEMTHKIDPKPLNNRTFPVIQVTASLEETPEFMVISIPLSDFDKSPYADFARDKRLVVAAYVSIERIRVLPSNSDVEWIMATASDAKGVLPQWMQNLAVPAAVAKDVEMFLGWLPSQRNSANGKPAPISKSAPPNSNEKAPPPISKTHDQAAFRQADSNKDLPVAPVQ
ncbi:hypothetical protein LAWI1_G006145 [Lachnellula willkommii]|uniref:DUF3074 domain-containing protein n=1 Tax=Lachnellula willkommii TaxID=215461 RepID=A0A559M4Q3_9HELO|nr:hypothetical protein LAWI1_G006145 [Lachnellula willkommii]